MPPSAEIPNGNGDQIKVGTTGTVSSLMSKELESIKNSAQASSSQRKKLQDPPVSVPCGYSPRRSHLRRNPLNDPSSTSSDNNSCGNQIPADAQKPNIKPRRNEHKAPMLASADTTTLESKKKGHMQIAEVVDIKCNNPMSGRLKKLGFSKLSDSTA